MFDIDVLPLTRPPPQITKPECRKQQQAAYEWVAEHAPGLNLAEAVSKLKRQDLVGILLFIADAAPRFYRLTAASLRHAKRLNRKVRSRK